MHISWLGGTATKIQVKPDDKDVIIVIDPVKPKSGSFPRSLSPQVGLYTNGQEDSITLGGDPFILDTPGECETKGVLITATLGHNPGTVLYRIDAEGMSVAHLGNTQAPLTNAQLDVLSGVDILLVPVGGENTYDAEGAVKAVNSVEPRIVIPIAFQSDNNPKAAPVDAFLKEIGAGSITPEKKFIIKKKDLPQEDIRTVVLEKE